MLGKVRRNQHAQVLWWNHISQRCIDIAKNWPYDLLSAVCLMDKDCEKLLKEIRGRLLGTVEIASAPMTVRSQNEIRNELKSTVDLIDEELRGKEKIALY